MHFTISISQNNGKVLVHSREEFVKIEPLDRNLKERIVRLNCSHLHDAVVFCERNDGNQREDKKAC
jgi:hypothetical protein